jgi:sugar phosphate isomerase/epimerase
LTRLGIGVQLYTLRNEMEADVEATLRKVAELGYEGVEFAGYFGWDADKLKQLLDDLDLKAIGSHVSLNNLRSNLLGEIAYLQTLGGNYLICPYVAEENRKSTQDWIGLFGELGKFGAEVNKHGLQLLYHNHDFEFHSQVDGAFVFDAMYASVKPELLKVEMDVCWVQFAGHDPLAYISKYAGRLPLLHLKDFTKDAEHKLVTLELGLGDVPLNEVITAAEKAGVEWLIVEQDHCQKPPLVSIENSLQWVKENYL